MEPLVMVNQVFLSISNGNVFRETSNTALMALPPCGFDDKQVIGWSASPSPDNLRHTESIEPRGRLCYRS